MNPEEGTPDSGLKPHHRLTRFICQELLYEFATGHLDADRQTAVDAFLTADREAQRELERLKRGLRYTSQATRLQVSAELRAALENFEPQWKKTFRAWTSWSAQRGWRLLPYAALLFTLALGLIVAKPWRRLRPNEITLIEQVRTEPDILSPPAEVKIGPSAALPLPAPPPTPVAEIAPEETAAPDAPAPLATAAGENETTPNLRGSLTRGDLEIGDFKHDYPVIRDKIIALGGKVAGNVELGWLRRKDEAYFHFSLPESNRAELDLFLKTFGPVRFSTERHPRVMPEGQIRIILTVKDGGSNHEEGPTETP